MNTVAHPPIVTRSEWLAERKRLLEAEKKSLSDVLDLCSGGGESLTDSYALLDQTPYGRQEDFEDSPAGWPQRPTYG